MHLSRQLNSWSLRCSWSIAWRHCSNYIFIIDLTLSFNGLDKDNCKARWETFKFWDLVHLILETLQCVMFTKNVTIRIAMAGAQHYPLHHKWQAIADRMYNIRCLIECKSKSWTSPRQVNQLQWLESMRGYQENSSSNDHQMACPICGV